MFSPTRAWNLSRTSLHSGMQAKKWTVTDSTILAARDPKVPEGGENSSAISKKATMAP